MVHVGVLGAGAVGSYVGARILAGNQGPEAVSDLKVTLVGRQSLLDAVSEAGNKITSRTVAGQTAVQDVGDNLIITDKMEALIDADIIVVAVKAAQTLDAAKELDALLPKDDGKARTIISLQNGVTNSQILRENINTQNLTVLPGLVVFNIVWSGAEFSQTSTGEVFIQDGPQMEIFGRMCNKGGIDTIVEKDITAKQYGKLLINLNNAINALSGIPTLQTTKDASFRKVSVLATNEAISVLDKAGIPIQSPSKTGYIRLLPVIFNLPEFLFKIVFPRIVTLNPKAKSSMLQDLERGRLTEVDLLNGEVVRVAKEHGFEVPKVNATLVELIKQAEGHGSPCLKGAELLAKVSS